MCKEYDVFRQCYCGCVFAAKQQGIDFKAIKKEAQEYVDNYEKENGKLVFTFNAD